MMFPLFQINKCERMICEMGDQFSDQLAMLASLIKEVMKMKKMNKLKLILDRRNFSVFG